MGGRNNMAKLSLMYAAFSFISISVCHSAEASTSHAQGQQITDIMDARQSANRFNTGVSVNASGGHPEQEHSISLAVLKYKYVQNPFLITVFLLTMCVLKILFEHCRRLHEVLPESCLLMLLGLFIGCLFLVKGATDELAFLKFSAQSFFLFLLPPIVLEAAYSLKDRAFADNLGTIMLYAVLGTILNVIIVGPCLYGLSGFLGTTWTLTFLECLLFSTIVAAVDPVAVLAIFKNMGVNKMLYFIVLGESIFNDGVTVVLYNTIIEFLSMETSIGPKELALGAARFVCVCAGATTIGIVIGFVTAFITRFTDRIQSIEPLLLYGFAYLSYLVAEMFDFSGIISLICCGLIQAHYAMENISSKSYISVHHFSKLTSSVTEALIFIILSVMAVNAHEAWADFNVGFALLAVVLCICSRFIVTYGLAYCVNRWLLGVRKISKRDQFVMAFGGLRGALTFSLAFSLDYGLLRQGQQTKHILLTSAFVVIFFTTFLQGITMKPLVKWVNVQLHRYETSVFGEINLAAIEHIATALEHIAGLRGAHYWSHKAKHLSRRFLRPLVNKYPHKKYNSVIAAYQKSIMESRYTAEQAEDGYCHIDTIPTTHGHWHHLEHLDNIRNPHASSADMLDRQDSYRRQFLKSQSASRRNSLAQPADQASQDPCNGKTGSRPASRASVTRRNPMARRQSAPEEALGLPKRKEQNGERNVAFVKGQPNLSFIRDYEDDTKDNDDSV